MSGNGYAVVESRRLTVEELRLSNVPILRCTIGDLVQNVAGMTMNHLDDFGEEVTVTVEVRTTPRRVQPCCPCGRGESHTLTATCRNGTVAPHPRWCAAAGCQQCAVEAQNQQVQP